MDSKLYNILISELIYCYDIMPLIFKKSAKK